MRIILILLFLSFSAAVSAQTLAVDVQPIAAQAGILHPLVEIVGVYPQPATAVATLVGIDKSAEWIVVSATGRKCLTGQGIELNIATLATGAYTVIGVRNGNQPFAAKLSVY